MSACVFKGCRRGARGNGACDDHQSAASLVLRGQAPACIHGVPLVDDCPDCSGESEQHRIDDSAAIQGRIDKAMRHCDMKLRELQRELVLRDFAPRLGPNGGTPVATHVAVPAGDGRVYAVRYAEGENDVGYVMYWGNVWILTASEVGGVTMFLEGVRARAGSLQ